MAKDPAVDAPAGPLCSTLPAPMSMTYLYGSHRMSAVNLRKVYRF